MPTIGSLTAVFDVDAGKFDAGLKHVDSGLKQTESHAKQTGQSLDNAFKSPNKSLADLSQNLNTVLGGRFSSLTQGVGTLSTSFTTLEGSATAAGVSMSSLAGIIGFAITEAAAGVTAIVVLSKGLFDLAKSTAEVQGNLYDLSQQTGVSVETLAGLGELAKTTGGNLQSVAQSLVIFQGNMEDASDVNSKAAKTFSQLKITVSDTENAFRAALQAIAAMPEGFQQTNAAAELFGRRGGKQMLAILKESKGDINSVIRELQGMGLANTDAARRADEFNDQLVKLDTQLMGLKAAIGNEIVPTITDGLKRVSQIIKENKDGFEALGFVAKGLVVIIGVPLLNAIQGLGAFWKLHQPIINAIREAYEATAAAMQLVTNRVPNVSPNAIPSQALGGESGLDLLNRAGAAWRATQAALPTDLSKLKGLWKDEKKPKAAGADPALAVFKQLRSELQGLNEVTKFQEISTRLLDKEFQNINPTLKEQLLTTAKIIDIKRRQIEVDRLVQQEQEKLKRAIDAEVESLGSFLQMQAETLRELRFGPKTALDEANDFINAFANVSNAMDENQKMWLRFNATLIHVQQTAKSLKEQLQDVSLIPPPNVLPVPEATGNVLSNAQIDALGVPPPAQPDLSEIRRKMRELGFELTDIFSRSVGDGFNNGIQSGLQTLEQGLLRIVEDIFLRRMAKGLEDILTNLSSGSSGGGSWWKTLLGIGSAVAGSAVGGGGGGKGGSFDVLGKAISRDSGGPIWPGQAFQLHKDEIVMPPGPAFVVPKGGMGQQVVNNHYTINLPPDARGSYSSPKSKRQLSETLIAALQSSQT